MNKQKTTLPSVRNIEWRTIKIEKEKMNKDLTYTQTKKHHWLKWTYQSKISLWENRDSFKDHRQKKKLKLGLEIRLEMEIRKLRKQAKMIKQVKYAGTCREK